METSQSEEIKSATAAWSTTSATKVENIDARLMKMLSTRSYEAVAQRAKANAIKQLQDYVGLHFGDLLLNHQSVESVIGTEGDEDGSWRIDPNQETYEGLLRAVKQLEMKLERVKAENNDLEAQNQDKVEKLRVVKEQNEKLETIRDAK